MKSHKIVLPDFLLADLYKDSLVVIDKEINTGKKQNVKADTGVAEEPMKVSEEPVISPDIETNKPLIYLGNNNKHISIIVNDENATHLQDDQLEILSAILTACKLNLSHVAIINAARQPVTDSLLRTALKPTVVLLFGVETAAIDLPFSIPDYKVQQFDNCAYVQSVSLKKMKGSTTEARMEKSKLWLCLKNLFAI